MRVLISLSCLPSTMRRNPSDSDSDVAHYRCGKKENNFVGLNPFKVREKKRKRSIEFTHRHLHCALC